jgi:hypothetical protein
MTSVMTVWRAAPSTFLFLQKDKSRIDFTERIGLQVVNDLI